MKKLPMILVLGIAICSFVLVAVNGLAAEPVGTGSESAQARHPVTPAVGSDTSVVFGALCAIEPSADWLSVEATCTAPPGCIDPAGYCDCVAGGTVPEWVCRWYACG